VVEKSAIQLQPPNASEDGTIADRKGRPTTPPTTTAKTPPNEPPSEKKHLLLKMATEKRGKCRPTSVDGSKNTGQGALTAPGALGPRRTSNDHGGHSLGPRRTSDDHGGHSTDTGKGEGVGDLKG